MDFPLEKISFKICLLVIFLISDCSSIEISKESESMHLRRLSSRDNQPSLRTGYPSSDYGVRLSSLEISNRNTILLLKGGKEARAAKISTKCTTDRAITLEPGFVLSSKEGSKEGSKEVEGNELSKEVYKENKQEENEINKDLYEENKPKSKVSKKYNPPPKLQEPSHYVDDS